MVVECSLSTNNAFIHTNTALVSASQEGERSRPRVRYNCKIGAREKLLIIPYAYVGGRLIYSPQSRTSKNVCDRFCFRCKKSYKEIGDFFSAKSSDFQRLAKCMLFHYKCNESVVGTFILRAPSVYRSLFARSAGCTSMRGRRVFGKEVKRGRVVASHIMSTLALCLSHGAQELGPTKARANDILAVDRCAFGSL